MSALRDQLLAIRDRHGYLDPAVVVEEARDKNHPLHHRIFDKPPKEAAEAYYLDRAHKLIQVVRVKYTDGSDRPGDVRAFHAIAREDSPRPVYEPIEEIALDDVKRRVLLATMEREWKTFRARYGALAEFVEMIRASLDEDAA